MIFVVLLMQKILVDAFPRLAGNASHDAQILAERGGMIFQGRNFAERNCSLR